MNAEELPMLLERLRERLAAFPHYFGAPELEIAEVATVAEVEAAEARLGVVLPGMLRDLYLRVGCSVSFSFAVHDARWVEDGYPDTGGAEVTIVSVRELELGRGGKLIPFTHDGIGNGWCLVAASERDDVVWHDHDDPDGERDQTAASVEEVFDDFVFGVLTRGAVAPQILTLLETGELPAPPPKPRPVPTERWRPDVALARDPDRVRLVALLGEPSCQAMVRLADTDRVLAIGERFASFVDVTTGELVHSHELGRRGWCASAHPDGKRVVVGGESGLSWLIVGDAAVGRSGAGNVTATAVDGGGRRLALGTRKGSVELWSFEDRTKQRELGSLPGVITGLLFTEELVIAVDHGGAMRAFRADGSVAWQADGLTRPLEVGPRLLAWDDRVFRLNGQLDMWVYGAHDGALQSKPAESVSGGARLRTAIFADPGRLLAGRAGARIEAWSASGAWQWTYSFDDGSEVVSILPAAGGRVLVASSAGWIAELDPAACAAEAERWLEMLTGLEDQGLAAAAKNAGLAEEAFADEMRAFERRLGLLLFEKPGRNTKRKRFAPPTLELTELAYALLCQDR